MKKYLVLAISAILVVAMSVVSFAQNEAPAGGAGAVNDSQADQAPNNVEETLIDFTEFEENLQKAGLYSENDEVREKAIADLDAANPAEVDPQTLAPAYKVKVSDMFYDRWVVQLNSSANTIKNRKWTYAKKVPLKAGKEFKGGQTEAGNESFGKGANVLGVRIHFPTHHHNANAKIAPPYEIRSYTDQGRVISRDTDKKRIGVIDNVGQIKKISIDVSGRNYKYGVAVRLKDQYDNVKEYFMGYTYYANWRRLNWDNPNYIESVDHRQLFRVPLYPREVPYRKFDSIIVYRPGQFMGGDFVVYFRKIDMWFDYAIPPEVLADLDIDDELNWGILAERARKRKRIETLKLREKVELMRNEERRMGKNAKNKDITKRQENQDNAAGGNAGGNQPANP